MLRQPLGRTPRIALGLALGLWAGAAGCSNDLQGACASLCDRGFDCGRLGSVSELEACKQDCAADEVAALEDIERGIVTQACYDAAVALMDCGSGLTCRELLEDEIPPACRPQATEVDAACGGGAT